MSNKFGFSGSDSEEGWGNEDDGDFQESHHRLSPDKAGSDSDSADFEVNPGTPHNAKAKQKKKRAGKKSKKKKILRHKATKKEEGPGGPGTNGGSSEDSDLAEQDDDADVNNSEKKLKMSGNRRVFKNEFH